MKQMLGRGIVGGTWRFDDDDDDDVCMHSCKCNGFDFDIK